MLLEDAELIEANTTSMKFVPVSSILLAGDSFA